MLSDFLFFGDTRIDLYYLNETNDNLQSSRKLLRPTDSIRHPRFCISRARCQTHCTNCEKYELQSITELVPVNVTRSVHINIVQHVKCSSLAHLHAQLRHTLAEFIARY